MPTYQYACTNPAGKHEFEVVQSFSEPSLTECIQCDNPARKVYGSVGVVFKGSGFYRTDSRAGAKSGGSAEKSGGEKSGGDKATGGDKAGGSSSAGEKSGSSSSSSKPSASGSGSSSGSSSKAAS